MTNVLLIYNTFNPFFRLASVYLTAVYFQLLNKTSHLHLIDFYFLKYFSFNHNTKVYIHTCTL